jgi:hypothetical protein
MWSADEGLTIITLPVRRAGPILPVANKRGKFQGMMALTTPRGTYLEIIVRLALSSIVSSGSGMVDIPRNHAMAASTSLWACGICIFGVSG